MRSLLSSCWMCLLVVATSTVVASEHPRLPSFTVTSSDGAAVASTALSTQPRWLLVYVSPDCRSCERLIESLKELAISEPHFSDGGRCSELGCSTLHH